MTDEEFLDALKAAWNMPGVNPKHHRNMKRVLQEGWPTLHTLLAALAEPETFRAIEPGSNWKERTMRNPLEEQLETVVETIMSDVKRASYGESYEGEFHQSIVVSAVEQIMEALQMHLTRENFDDVLAGRVQRRDLRQVDYTPTTEEVRAAYLVAESLGGPVELGRVTAEFNSWLAEQERKAAEQAWWNACLRIANGENLLDIAHVYQKQSPYLEVQND